MNNKEYVLPIQITVLYYKYNSHRYFDNAITSYCKLQNCIQKHLIFLYYPVKQCIHTKKKYFLQLL